MGTFDYSKEEVRDILMIDCKSFYASCECVERGLNPLTAMLVVGSHSEEHPGSGLVLAASPTAKRILGISNVTRMRDIPTFLGLIIAPPQMRLYIKIQMKIKDIFLDYVSDEDLLVYSIDESILDVTASLNYFFPDEAMTRREKRDKLAQMIQRDVYRRTGIYTTCGIGDNNLLAKLALDISAKHTSNMRAEWTYEEVQEKVWQISPMSEMWMIGKRTERNLKAMGIDTIKQLANTDPYKLKEKMGVIGLQLFHHANGIDRTRISDMHNPTNNKRQERSLSNSQILNRNYEKEEDIILVIREMAEQTISRVRRRGNQTQVVSLFCGYSMDIGGGFSRQMKVQSTNSTKEVTTAALAIFHRFWDGSPVRQIGIGFGRLVETQAIQLDLFRRPDEQINENKIDQALDIIRNKYGFTSLVHASSLLSAGRSIARASLLGGHAGGMDGLVVKPEEKERDES